MNVLLNRVTLLIQSKGKAFCQESFNLISVKLHQIRNKIPAVCEGWSKVKEILLWTGVKNVMWYNSLYTFTKVLLISNEELLQSFFSTGLLSLLKRTWFTTSFPSLWSTAWRNTSLLCHLASPRFRRNWPGNWKIGLRILRLYCIGPTRNRGCFKIRFLWTSLHLSSFLLFGFVCRCYF